MALLYIVNYLIFAAFLSLFAIEIGIGIVSIFFYNPFKEKIRRYLLPLWEVDGTFGVFYLVNLIATYPSLLVVASLYAPLLLVAALIFLLRNIFISYAEYISREEHEARYMRIYGISTLVLSFVVISVFTSGVSGTGISVIGSSIDFAAVLFNPFNILMFASVAVISLFISVSYLDMRRFKKLGYLLLPASFVIAVAALYLYVPYMFNSFVSNYYIPALSLIVMAIVIIAKLRGSNKTPHLAALWFFVSITLFGIIQYPYLLGGTSSFTGYSTNSSSGDAIALVTLVGGAILAASMLLLFYINYIKKRA